jgi:uncharacterized protein (DUF58 family)
MTAEFCYKIGHPATGHRPGSHRSLGQGSGFEFREHAPLLADPEPRRLDLYASCRHPHGALMVRVFRPRRAITVYVIADVSASMGFGGARRKLDVVADLAAATACSAQRVGDAFGFIGANGMVLDELRVAPSRARGWGQLIAERLRRHVPSGDSASGLLAAAQQLGRHRALVFLASDFHFPRPQLEQLLAALARHVVVPVVLWDPAEFEPPNRWGIEVLRDLETGRRRLLFMRPALRARIALARAERQRELAACWRRHGVRALWLPDGFEAARITQYFLDAHA